MIASYYAEPVERRVAMAATLVDQPSADGATIAKLAAGDPFLMLDDSLGWAWGYGGKDQRVGYLPSGQLER